MAGEGSGGDGVSGVADSGDGGGGNMGNGGGGDVGDGGLVGDGGAVGDVGLLSVHGDGAVLVDGGGVGLGDLLAGVGPGLVHKGLVDGLVGPDGSVDLLGAEGGDVLEDGLGHVGSLDDGSGLVGGDGGGDVGLDGLSDGVGQGGDLGGDLGEGVGLGGGVGEVAAQPVVLDGGRVMGRGPDQGGGAVPGEADLAGHLRPGGGRGHEGCEGQEGLRQKISY